MIYNSKMEKDNKNKSFKNYLDNFNIYGINIPLRYHQNSYFSSSIGILFSILTFLSLIGIIIKNIIELFNYSNFSLIQSSAPYDSRIDFSEIPLMLGLIDNEGKLYSIDESFFSLSVKKIIKNPIFNEKNHFSGLNISINNLTLEKCNESIHFYNYKEKFVNYSKDTFLCLKPGQDLNIKGQVRETRTGYETIRIDVILCNKNTSNNCKNDKQINRELNNKFLILIYLSQSPDHFNINNPVRTVAKTSIFYLSKKNPKEFLFFFTPSAYYTDNGLLFSNEKIFRFPDFSDIQIDFLNSNSSSTGEENTIFSLFFTCNEYNVRYQRKYTKISQVFSSIGGIIQIFLIVFQTLTEYLGSKNLIEEITDNLIFNRNNDNKNKTIKLKTGSSIIRKSSRDSSNKKLKKNSDNIITKLNEKKNFTTVIGVYNHSNFIKEKNNLRIHISNINDKKLKVPILGYFLPYFILKKLKKYSMLCLYKDIIYSYLSIEKILPILERYSLFLYNHLNEKQENKKKSSLHIFKYDYKDA